MAALMEQSFDADKLSYEIFSILESKFLSSSSPLESPLKSLAAAGPGKVRVLSIDAAPDGGILAALSLSRLEALLKKETGDPSSCVSAFFDAAAGSGAGGVLAAMLFTRGQDGRPLFSADEALRFLCRNRRRIAPSSSPKNGSILRKIFRTAASTVDAKCFAKTFGDATLRDAIKPTLISCFDLVTGSPFMFSRSDAVESDAYDFTLSDVCAATCAADQAVHVQSIDGRTTIKAVGGAVGVGNPTAAAITHVLNNKREFPFAAGPEDLLVVSLGSAESVSFSQSSKLAAKIAKIAGEGATDTVDQSVAMAFGQNTSTNYVRIQANGLSSQTKTDAQSPVSAAEKALAQRYIESVMFRGRRISDQTNGEKIEWATAELIEEDGRRKQSSVPTVLIKPAVASPRSSSATTTTTVTSTATSASLC